MKRFNSNIGRVIFSKQVRQNSDLKDGIRNAQAAEIFRSAFLDASRANTRISVTDLDELVISEKVRPSILLPAFQVVGTVLGMATRFSPSKDCSQFIAKTVNDATTQQFNDIVRDMHFSQDGSIDTKETLKYHRDLETDYSSNSAASVHEEHNPHQEHHADPNHSHNTKPPQEDTTQFAAMTVLYNILKVARTI